MKNHTGKYILKKDGKTPIPEPDLLKWAEWIEGTGKRRVSLSRLGESRGPRVSTVFLGLDHSFSDEGPPVLWETMVFGGPWKYEPQERYTSYEDALIGHEKWLRKTIVACLLYPFFWVQSRALHWSRGIYWRIKRH